MEDPGGPFFTKDPLKFISFEVHKGLGVPLGFVKLHSELALPTELQFDRVGVDFVFPPSQQITSNNK